MTFLGSSNLGDYVFDSILSVILLVLTVATLFIAVWMLVKYSGKNFENGLVRPNLSVKKLLIVILAIGFALRLIPALFVIGQRREFDEIIYSALDNPTGKLYPFSYYIIKIFSIFSFGAPVESSVWANFCIKLPFILADLATAFGVFVIAKKYSTQGVGLVLCALVAICPVFVFASAFWGSYITLALPFMLFALYFMLCKKHAMLMLFYACAMLTCKEACVIFPALFVYYAVVWFKSLSFRGEKSTMEEKLIPVLFVGVTLISWIISLPYLIDANKGWGLFDFIYKYFIAPFINVGYFGYNSLSVYPLFGKYYDFLSINVGNGFNGTLMFVAFLVVVSLIAFVIYWLKKNRALMTLVCAYIAITIFTYFVDFTAVSMLPALALLLVAYLVVKDKRILKTFIITSVLMISVMCLVFIRAGYFNALPLDAFTKADYTSVYHRMTLLCGDFEPAMIVLAIFTVINHVYMTIYVYDIAIRKKVVPIEINESVDFRSGLRHVLYK